MTVTTSRKLFNAARTLLASVVWTSALIFGVYILLFYALAYVSGNTAQWNEVLPGLYDANNGRSTAGIAVHFLGGGIILVLGCLQLIERVRKRYPQVHRIIGRVYIIASLLAAVGGLTFIFLKGTIGGWVMDVAFTGYGLLMGLAALQTVRHARAGRYERHRAWAIRLFALAIGSWLYRMGYGFYLGFGGGEGHTSDFRGWFDYVMDFAFYLPGLLVAEVIIARRAVLKRKAGQLLGAGVLTLTSLLLIVATYFFARELWGPGIMSAFG